MYSFDICTLDSWGFLTTIWNDSFRYILNACLFYPAVLCFLHSKKWGSKVLSTHHRWASAERLRLGCQKSVLTPLKQFFALKTIICSNITQHRIASFLIYNYISRISLEMAQLPSCCLQGLTALKTCLHRWESSAFKFSPHSQNRTEWALMSGWRDP